MTLLAVHFTFILDYINDVRQKANSRDFYSSSKWVVKQQRQLATSTTHLAQKLLMNVQCGGGSRSFAKEMRALQMSTMASHWKLTNNSWEPLLKLILLQLHEEVPKNSMLTIWSFGIWSKLERWKSSISGCLVSWPKVKKKMSFGSVIFSYSVQQETITWSDCDVWWKVDFIWQPAMISSEAGPRRSSKALPKAKLSPRKGSWSLLVVCSQPEPLQFSESWWKHYIWEECSVRRWDALKTAMPAASIGQQKGSTSPWQCPTAHHTTNASKV